MPMNLLIQSNKYGWNTSLSIGIELRISFNIKKKYWDSQFLNLGLIYFFWEPHIFVVPNWGTFLFI